MSTYIRTSKQYVGRKNKDTFYGCFIMKTMWIVEINTEIMSNCQCNILVFWPM